MLTQEAKDELVKRAVDHRNADRLRQHYGYFHSGKGCAIGCLATSIDVADLTWTRQSSTSSLDELAAMGVPWFLSVEAEYAFERLPEWAARVWPEEFARALPVGVKFDEDEFHRWRRANGPWAGARGEVTRRQVLGYLASKRPKRSLWRVPRNEQRESTSADVLDSSKT